MDIDEFRAFDARWSRLLRGPSLVSEAGIDIEESFAALQFIARLYEQYSHSRRNRTHILAMYPATVLTGLTAVASDKYDEGTFWPKVENVAEIEMGQTQQNEFSEAFQTGLKSFGLSRFTTPQRNIGEILMHAGIRAPSIEGFMRLLHRRDNRQIDLTGDDFCSWVGQMPRLEASAKGLDVPTWRFLSEGGEVSADLVTRMLAVLYAISSPGHELESALAALPPHIAEEVRRLLMDGSFISARNHHESRQRSSGPQIVFREGQVQVRLPSLEMILHEKVDWRLEIPGQTWIKQVGARWEGDPVTATFEPIPGPQTEITVSVIGRDLQWTLQIIDLNSQIMAFDSGNDVLIPPRNALPKNRVWIAFPNETDAEVSEALDVAGNIQIVHQPNTPYGWGGWTFALVDLSDVRHFNKKSAENLRARFVSAIERPTIEASTPADFIRAEVGLPIFTRRPYVTLPQALRRELRLIGLCLYETRTVRCSLRPASMFRPKP